MVSVPSSDNREFINFDVSPFWNLAILFPVPPLPTNNPELVALTQDNVLLPLVERMKLLLPSDEGQVYATPPKVVDAEAVKFPATERYPVNVSFVPDALV